MPTTDGCKRIASRRQEEKEDSLVGTKLHIVYVKSCGHQNINEWSLSVTSPLSLAGNSGHGLKKPKPL